MIRKLIAAWRKRRQHERNINRFFTLLKQEQTSLGDCLIGLAEVYADAQRMAIENQQKSEEA